jgi:hypothetical protein
MKIKYEYGNEYEKLSLAYLFVNKSMQLFYDALFWTYFSGNNKMACACYWVKKHGFTTKLEVPYPDKGRDPDGNLFDLIIFYHLVYINSIILTKM